jgi:hypothetical protein
MQDYQQILKQTLETKEQELNYRIAPLWRGVLQQLSASFQSFYNLCLESQFCKSWHYDNDLAIENLDVPEGDSLGSQNYAEKMGERLALLAKQYDYLAYSVTIVTIALPIPQLKKIHEILKYIDWTNLYSGDTNYMTQQMALFIQNYKDNNVGTNSKNALVDPVHIISSLHTQLIKNLQDALNYWHHYYFYAIESYKSYIGGLLFNQDDQKNWLVNTESHFLGVMKNELMAMDPPLPFYSEWIAEMYQENFSPRAPILQQQALQKLAIIVQPLQEQNDKKNQDQLKELMLKITQNMGRVILSYETICTKTVDNFAISQKNYSWWQMIKKYIEELFTPKNKYIYHAKFVDFITDVAYEEDIDYFQLKTQSTRLLRRIKLLKMGETENSGHNVLKELDALIEELRFNIIHHLGITTCFNEYVSARKIAYHNINPDITALRHSINALIAQSQEYAILYKSLHDNQSKKIPEGLI